MSYLSTIGSVLPSDRRTAGVPERPRETAFSPRMRMFWCGDACNMGDSDSMGLCDQPKSRSGVCLLTRIGDDHGIQDGRRRFEGRAGCPRDRPATLHNLVEVECCGGPSTQGSPLRANPGLGCGIPLGFKIPAEQLLEVFVGDPSPRFVIGVGRRGGWISNRAGFSVRSRRTR
jgi:hypothetical protein